MAIEPAPSCLVFKHDYNSINEEVIIITNMITTIIIIIIIIITIRSIAISTESLPPSLPPCQT